MKLDVHIIEPRPTSHDPLAQRGHAALIWGEDKELVEFDVSDLQSCESAVPAHVALVMAMAIFVQAGGKFNEALPAIGAYAQKLIAKGRGA